MFWEKTKPYFDAVGVFAGEEMIILEDCRKNPAGAGKKLLGLSEKMLDLTSNYLVLNNISVLLLKTKNPELLEDARKALCKALIYAEHVVSRLVEAYFDEYKALLAEITSVTPAERYRFLRKLGLTLDLLKDAFGDNSKWKWSFVELDGRVATVIKNLFDLGDTADYMNMTSANYETLAKHAKMIRSRMLYAAKRYRERHELAGKNIQDIRTGLNFLRALYYFNRMLGGTNDDAALKKQIDSWEALEENLQKH
jgi:hypothetical protein